MHYRSRVQEGRGGQTHIETFSWKEMAPSKVEIDLQALFDGRHRLWCLLYLSFQYRALVLVP